MSSQQCEHLTRCKTFRTSTVIFAALRASHGAVKSSNDWLSAETHVLSKGLFFISASTASENTVITDVGTQHINIMCSNTFDWRPPFWSNGVGNVQPAKRRPTVWGRGSLEDGPLSGQTCQWRLKHSRAPNNGVINPKVSVRVLPSFAGMHNAPSNARLQTHVHATSRMPQLHQRDCMAHPKNTTGNRGGGYFS